jgi:hypothetical protein
MNNFTKSQLLLINLTTIKITLELKDIIKKLQIENDLYIENYFELSNKYTEMLKKIYDQMQFKRNKPNYFALSCLIFSDINCIDKWGDVINYIVDYTKKLSSDYFENDEEIKCCCSKNIQRAILFGNEEFKRKIIMGNICCDKYEIIESNEIYQIKKQQDIIKETKERIKEYREKCVNCKVYGITECNRLNYHKD